ncbi:hypothetical protein SJI00_12695 [Pseudomonas sp. RP23018S]|nr:hypothetical protein [Pseudomonas sp. RP23018S]MDZ5603634.1 hypothetical protein [Pseudomonas sp. RP23018S]
MALAHTLGFAHTAHHHALNAAHLACGRGEQDRAEGHAITREWRAEQWQVLKAAGIELLPVDGCCGADRVLTHSLAFGVQPAAVLPTNTAASDHLQTGAAVDALLTPWFNTTTFYNAPHFAPDQVFTLNWDALFEEVAHGHALGHAVKPVLLGPLTYLWLGQPATPNVDTLELIDRLLPLYDTLLNRLAAQGVEWVQIDEPILALELPQAWKNAYERVYNILQRAPLKKLVATYYGGLQDNLGLAANLPVDGLHIDLACAPEQYPIILDRVPAYKVLSLGVVSGLQAQPHDQQNALRVLRHAAQRLGERLWVATSCPMLASAIDEQGETESQRQHALAFAAQACRAVSAAANALNQPHAHGPAASAAHRVAA